MKSVSKNDTFLPNWTFHISKFLSLLDTPLSIYYFFSLLYTCTYIQIQLYLNLHLKHISKARYDLICVKVPLNLNQPTNQPAELEVKCNLSQSTYCSYCYGILVSK